MLWVLFWRSSLWPRCSQKYVQRHQIDHKLHLTLVQGSTQDQLCKSRESPPLKPSLVPDRSGLRRKPSPNVDVEPPNKRVHLAVLHQSVPLQAAGDGGESLNVLLPINFAIKTKVSQQQDNFPTHSHLHILSPRSPLPSGILRHVSHVHFLTLSTAQVFPWHTLVV